MHLVTEHDIIGTTIVNSVHFRESMILMCTKLIHSITTILSILREIGNAAGFHTFIVL